MQTFEDFEAPGRKAKMGLAVSCDRITVIHNGKAVDIEVIKPPRGDAYAVYRGTHITLAGYKVPSKVIDGVSRWKQFI